MINFHGNRKRKTYFEGWYLKHQNTKDTIAMIPAYHVNSMGEKSASLQIITNEGQENIPFSVEEFQPAKDRFCLRLGGCSFSQRGCRFNLPNLQGKLDYKHISKPKYDIMGPFRYVPFMECRHTVVSMVHQVDGKLTYNGKIYTFHNGRGYIEGDRGASFPKEYLWTQANWQDCGVMLCVATIPMIKGGFIGTIGFVYVGGKEYRLATYLGAKILAIDENSVILRQRNKKLQVRLIEPNPKPLYAPSDGEMERIIHESASCKVHYEFFINGEKIFSHISSSAAFEESHTKM
ncbi:MAG: tocopherol cyclase family protein [Anaerovoracaceae bacterium]